MSRSLPVLDPDDLPSPLTAAEEKLRPCPWACRHNLTIDVSPASGAITLREPASESCALDVADRGGITLDEIGELLGVSRQRIEQIERAAMRKVRKRASSRPAHAGLLELALLPDDPPIQVPGR